MANAVPRPSASLWPMVAWLLTGLALACVAAAAVLSFTNRATFDDLSQANLIEIILPVGFAVVGGLVAARLPANPMGWLFLGISLCEVLLGLTSQYTRYATLVQPGAPFSPWIPWVGNFTANLVYPAGLATVGFLLTPNGRLPSDRWRLVLWAAVLVTAASAVTTMIDPDLTNLGPPEPPIPNPTGVPAVRGISAGPIGIGLFLVGLGILALAGASVVLRLRRASSEERLQLRWIAYAAVFSVAISLFGAIEQLIVRRTPGTDMLVTVATTLGFGMALPASFGVAILRYRMYDLDLLLNRTVVYGAVSLLLAATVAVADVLLQRAMESTIHQRSELVSVGLGLAAGVAFGPLRRRVRAIVDRILPARSRQALLFMDIVASTQALVDLGDERWRELLEEFRATVRRELARYKGREINTAGDAFFAAFDRPTAAVRCAEAIRDAVSSLGLRVRIGLHVGDVEMRGEQMSGLAVHAAARVMGEAGDGQILVSRELADQLGEDVPLTDAGRHQLRGVPGEWQLYAVLPN